MISRRRFGLRAAVQGSALLVIALGLGCSAGPEVLAISSGGSLGNYYSAARAIARVVNANADENGFRLEQAESTGSVANIEAVVSGARPLGIAQADIEYQAVKGEGRWQEAGPQNSLCAVLGLYTDAVTLVASPSSGIRTLQDLKGRRVDLGHPDSGGRQNAIDVLSSVGLDWQRDLVASGEEPNDRTSKYLSGDLDAFFHTVGHPAADVTFAVNSVERARLVPIQGERLLAEHPYYSRTWIPIDLYPGLENAAKVPTVGVKVVLLSSCGTPDDTVHAITRALFEGIDSLGKFDPVLAGLDPIEMARGTTAPLHPGALRYYEEAGLR